MDTYAIYDSPTDYPGLFVARRFESVGGEPLPREVVAVERNLGDCRAIVRHRLGGCGCCIPRDESDEPQIVETWV